MRGSMIRVKHRIERIAHQLSGKPTMATFPLFLYQRHYPENRKRLAAELLRRRRDGLQPVDAPPPWPVL